MVLLIYTGHSLWWNHESHELPTAAGVNSGHEGEAMVLNLLTISTKRHASASHLRSAVGLSNLLSISMKRHAAASHLGSETIVLNVLYISTKHDAAG